MVRGARGWFGEASADAVVHIGDAPANVYFIEPDHLGTPRLIADENQKTVWRWDNQEPFGADMPNEDPDGDGVAFDFALRFPGQYFDRETNLAYNYFREYSADTGRYVESDPIGLKGSLNAFLYTLASPLNAVDPEGLITCVFDRKSGVLTCISNVSDKTVLVAKAASGNNSIPGCKNNGQCEAESGVGPIPRGCWYWTGQVGSRPDRRFLAPLPGTDPRNRGNLQSHLCTNPFGPSVTPPYCSEGCVTGKSSDIQKLNQLLDAEPTNVLCVVN
jgi:RHS repeat-associated protein